MPAARAARGDLRELLGNGEIEPSLFDRLVADGALVREERWIYRRPTAELEAELAAQVQALVTGPVSPRLREPDAARGSVRAHEGAADGPGQRVHATACR